MYQRPSSFRLLPDVIKNLLIINGLFYVATFFIGPQMGFNLIGTLGLYLPGSPNFEPYQLITHMFMHGGFGHILLNMFALWMFGYALENFWGPKRFLIYYMLTGLGAAVIHLGINYWEAMNLQSELYAQGYNNAQLREAVNYFFETGGSGLYSWSPELTQYVLKYGTPTVGASGAVFGVLLAFGMMFPNTYIYLYFAIPIKAKYFVMIYGAIELFNGIQNDPDSNVAHFAHLGGMLIGYLLITYWRKSNSYQQY